MKRITYICLLLAVIIYVDSGCKKSTNNSNTNSTNTSSNTNNSNNNNNNNNHNSSPYTGNVSFSGVVLDGCTGKPYANKPVTFWVQYAGCMTLVQGQINSKIGQTNTDNNGAFNFSGSYDLSKIDNSYICGVSDFSINAAGSTADGNLNYFMYVVSYDFIMVYSEKQSNIVLNVYPLLNSITFVNTKGIVNPDTTQQPYISVYFYDTNNDWVFVPTHSYKAGNSWYANDTCVGTSYHSYNGFIPNILTYNAVYYRKSADSVKQYNYQFTVNCKTPIALP